MRGRRWGIERVEQVKQCMARREVSCSRNPAVRLLQGDSFVARNFASLLRDYNDGSRLDGTRCIPYTILIYISIVFGRC